MKYRKSYKVVFSLVNPQTRCCDDKIKKEVFVQCQTLKTMREAARSFLRKNPECYCIRIINLNTNKIHIVV